MVAVMLPAAEYHALVQTVRLKIAAFLFIASFFILISVLWTSKKYVAPILKGLEQIKANTDLAQEESPVLCLPRKTGSEPRGSFIRFKSGAAGGSKQTATAARQAGTGQQRSGIRTEGNCPTCLFQTARDRSR